jgi:hypothetical protein
VRGRDEVLIQRLRHILVDAVVQWIECVALRPSGGVVDMDKHTHTDTHTDKHTHTHTHTEAHTDTHTDTHRHTHTQIKITTRTYKHTDRHR